jgi:hypothetical protein
LSKNKHLCTNCKKIINDASKVLFVDQSRMLGYCCESCIVSFNTPLMESFENDEIEFREKLNLPLSELHNELYQDSIMLDKLLYEPEEVYEFVNHIGIKYYTHISKFKHEEQEYFYIIIASYFNNSPAFIYFKLITEYADLADKYREGNPYDISQPVSPEINAQELEAGEQAELTLPEAVVEDIEMKKSEYLAKLLEARSEEDVPFEKFPEYDEYLPMVLDEPDEIFSQTDESGDDVKVFIKSFKINKTTFFYIAICIEIELPEFEDQKALLPVLGFPSQDSQLYKEYAFGEKLSQMTKN